jgi:hypothetical protein
MKRRARSKLTPNPFVVLTDMTIGLSFILAVHGLVATVSSSQALAIAKRFETQQQMIADIAQALSAERADVRLVPLTQQDYSAAGIGTNGSERISRSRRFMVDRDGRRLVEFEINGNYVRIKVLAPTWKSGESVYGSTIGRAVYRSIAPTLKLQYSKSIAYLYAHGISEVKECQWPTLTVSERKAKAIELSRQRADIVLTELRSSGLVGPLSAANAEVDQSGNPLVPAKFAIAFGTGDSLYGLGTDVGRVDLLLFFKDANPDEKLDSSSRVGN